MRGMRRGFRTSACRLAARSTVMISRGHEREQAKRVKAGAEEVSKAIMDVCVPQDRACGGRE
eukprot:1739147-Pleurochrysis_carterae.AAC.1